ncbi:MAG: 30S ribosomal protein S13 [Candidatus Magasanikbacteria bacterium CG10_big_fil_rev_8_21_14_0_10_36_32]|uniref:Small ribosomal subunit protein uS13 n=1 Tax=Candidatus Magasanikbacteria bacterium CG10_big_fil_rev_8_21_14_0_10_36_32 TaxID=1974646 RepID=A0A2M6W7P4_9BACT|nr:MAG: 30S ribosomal protein S13 [Candidatus Magasanikbacteria bacterium CG10_big_fil_rev_8_21_14_0_10_36_32]
MMRIVGINIPKEKRIVISLSYIYGIGNSVARKILAQAKISEDIRTKDLTSDQEDRLRMIIEKECMTEGDLRREVGSNIKRLKDVKCYRGVRHMKHLPARGQRTKTNSRTAHGNTRKTMGSGRKASGIKT